MRTMINPQTGQTLKVCEHIITKNFWEYYLTDEQTYDPNMRFCLVMGFETEMGSVWMPEIQPYIISRTKDLQHLAPASGWEWERV